MRSIAYLPLGALSALAVGATSLMIAQQRQAQPYAAAPAPVIQVHILATPARIASVDMHQANAPAAPTDVVALSATAVAMGIASDAAVAPTPAPTLAPMPTATQSDFADARAEMLSLHNRARAEAGLPMLAVSSSLQAAAQLQADFLASKPAHELIRLGPNGHAGPNGEMVAERAARLGYAGSAVSENWAYMSNAHEAIDFWLTDQWHRPQVLSSDLLEVGFGISQQPEFGLVFVAAYGKQ